MLFCWLCASRGLRKSSGGRLTRAQDSGWVLALPFEGHQHTFWCPLIICSLSMYLLPLE